MAFKRSRYTDNQRAAYNSGRGYAVAHDGRKIEFKGGREGDMYNSFMAGYRAGKSAIERSPDKYPKNPKPRKRSSKNSAKK